MPAAAPAAPAIEGSARRWRRLAWWSLFIAGNAVLAAAIALGNVPLRDNPGGGAGDQRCSRPGKGFFINRHDHIIAYVP